MIDGEIVYVTIKGPRPPFTAESVAVGASEIDGVCEGDAAIEPLKMGDKVRDMQGREFEVISPPRETEAGVLQVGLWSETIGFDFDYPINLERVES